MLAQQVQIYIHQHCHHKIKVYMVQKFCLLPFGSYGLGSWRAMNVFTFSGKQSSSWYGICSAMITRAAWHMRSGGPQQSRRTFASLLVHISNAVWLPQSDTASRCAPCSKRADIMGTWPLQGQHILFTSRMAKWIGLYPPWIGVLMTESAPQHSKEGTRPNKSFRPSSFSGSLEHS